MNQVKVIKYNLVFILIMAISGLVFGFLTGSKSIITDGVVSTVIFITSSIGIYVHTRLYPKDIYSYPYGKWRLEYIYNLIRMVTLLAIILYSFLESIFIIFHYFMSDIVPKEVVLQSLIPYFIIKLTAVMCSMIWLKRNRKRNNIDQEAFQMEYSSIIVDGCLTFAILIGILVFGQISVISEVADACTLMIVAILLGFSVCGELKHLVLMMIGKRIFFEQEKRTKKLIEMCYPQIKVRDVYIEKHGLVTMFYIRCSFSEAMCSSDLYRIECELKAYLRIQHVAKPRLHFYFE